MKRWNIYYSLREYAHEKGDPLLATIEARTKEEAEAQAAKQVSDNGAGLLAVQDDHSRCDHCHNLDYVEDMRQGVYYPEICSLCNDMGL